jgi:Cytochrome c
MIQDVPAPLDDHCNDKPVRTGARRALSILLAVAACKASIALAESPRASAELIEKGRLIYEAGQLTLGGPLRADRGQLGIATAGRAAACVNCHQRSGFGLFEATNLVPPVTGPSLFSNVQPRAATGRRAKGMQHEEFSSLERPPYDERTLARALREGISPSGHLFQYLMPRYALNDDDMAALIAYLRQLSMQPSPGIDETIAHFATVVAPDQDAARRRAFIEVLQACFRERHPPEAGGHAWQLHVWELTGSPDTWQAQLEAKYVAQPVFALISGLGNEEWEPVHRFSETKKIPSLFPNLNVAPTADREAYGFYFAKGATLEAEVVAQYFAESAGSSGLTRVVQLSVADGAGAKAAAALRNALKQQSIPIAERIVTEATSEQMVANLLDLAPSDMLVIWLNQSQLAALAGLPPPNAGQIMFSGWLSGLENAPVPANWKSYAWMVYPVDAPQRRDARMQFNLRPWLRKHSIEHSDEILLGNTLAACNLLSESMSRLRGFYFRDYLVEMLENYPSGMGNAPASQAFPRFTLGPGQRYSSKGAYIVRFKDAKTSELELVHDWLVPP